MTSLRSLLAASVFAAAACIPAKVPEPGAPAPARSVRYIGVYTPAFEDERFRPCNRLGLLSGDDWRVVFTNAALAERNHHMAQLGDRGTVGPRGPVRLPLIISLTGRVMQDVSAPGAARILVVDRVLALRESSGRRISVVALFRPCANMSADDVSHSQLTSR